jgi:hypothetical protein
MSKIRAALHACCYVSRIGIATEELFVESHRKFISSDAGADRLGTLLRRGIFPSQSSALVLQTSHVHDAQHYMD